jgi:CheY-like chemotaxis protein/tetratricopeptide (TPR) repeat protein
MELSHAFGQLDKTTQTPDERARFRCQLAAELEESGDYEGACVAMGDFWEARAEEPDLGDLDESTRAEVVLRIGVLSGWMGSARQIEGGQERAKDLISRSILIFEGLRNPAKVAEAQSDLAYCYWRQGAFDEARVILSDALSRLTEDDNALKPVVYLRRALLENCAGSFQESVRILTKAAPLFKDKSHALLGKFHNTFALALRNLGTTEQGDDHIDRALIEYAAASFHFEQAGHTRYCARVENNLGFLFHTINRFEEAHSHLDRARECFIKLDDRGSAAQVDDTRARVFLAEGRNHEAECAAQAAVWVLETGGEHSLLSGALTTLGVAQAQTAQYESCRTLLRAIEVAERVGDHESAGIAALSIVEELSDHLTALELADAFKRASEHLSASQDHGVLNRMLVAASQVSEMLKKRLMAASNDTRIELLVAHQWEGFLLKKEVRSYERLIVERALKDADGSVSRAAQLLGFKHHQSLISLINSQHRDLLGARSIVRPRKRSILSDDSRCKKSGNYPSPDATRRITILHVEDNRHIAKLVRDIALNEGWLVEACYEVETALVKLEGHGRYSLLLVDNDLPGLSGVELVRRTRKISHRRRTPIIILSGSDCEADAWRSGADAFLRKPQDIGTLALTVSRLLN